MDVDAYLDRLEQIAAEGRPVPLSASIIVGKRELDEALAGLRAQLPDEMRQSRWVLKERDEVVDQARREADRILADAREAAERKVSDTEVVHAARREAERIIEDAQEEAKVLRLEAEDYIDNKLATFEIALNKTLEAVERGRERLRGRMVADELTPEDAGEEAVLAEGEDGAGEPVRPHIYDHEGQG